MKDNTKLSGRDVTDRYSVFESTRLKGIGHGNGYKLGKII